MMNNLLESLSALVYPVECAICSISMAPNPPLGVCGTCQAKAKLINAPHCISCGRTLAQPAVRCTECQDESFAFDRAYACAVYEGPMRQLIHLYKFENRKYLKYYFIKLMREFIEKYLIKTDYDITLAVPISKERWLERGFDQSELISSEIAKHCGISHSSGNLIHIHPGAPQSLLAKNQRKMNVKGAFLVRNSDEFHSKRLLLIDDILTTGYTASECAKTLKRSGAASVTVLTLARGE